jgi:hypothetical protein
MLNCQEVSGWNYPSSDLSNMTAVVITAANKLPFRTYIIEKKNKLKIY